MAESKIKEEEKMHIPIWLLAIVGVIGFIFLTPYRQGLTKLFSTIWDLICGATGRLWDFIRGVSPTGATTTTILGYVRMALMFIALAVILFVVVLYLIIGASIMTVGVVTGHWQAALLLLLALSTWGMLSAFPSFLFFKPLVWTSRWIVRPIAIALFIYLAIVSIWWVFGNISPRLQGSFSRSAENTTAELANKVDKDSMKSEPEMGVFAKVTEDSQIYNQPSGGLPTSFAKMGTLVMILVKENQLEGKRADKDSEGRTKVMLSDRHGDFNKGNEGWIATRKLNWDWQSKLQPEPRANVPAASALGKIPQLCWKKQDGHAGNGIFKEYCSELTHLDIDGEKITLRARNGDIGEQILVGNNIGDFEFKGSWTQNPKNYEGAWQLRFSPDLKTAVGWQTNKGDSTKIYTWIK